MKVIVNNIIPFRGFRAVTIWPFIFVRRSSWASYTYDTDRHEHIHGQQQLEMLMLPFFVWYMLEWAVRLAIMRDNRQAYRSVSLEQEAYAHERDRQYLKNRRPYNWLRYLFK